MGYKKVLVFNAEQEAIIAEYLLKRVNIYFGLLPTDMNKLAYQCAMFYNIEKIPESWKTNDDLSLNLENPEVLDDVTNLDISVTEVISQISNEPVAGSSGMQKGASDFSVEIIKPLPKAPPRVSSNRKRAKKSAILTDTPEKNSLEEEHNIREMKKRKMTTKNQNKENKKDKGKGKGKAKGNINKDEKVGKVKKRILNESNSSNDDDEYFCIICGASYNENTSGGEWIQCISCKDWAQAGCIKGDITSFCCLHCDSDDKYE